VIAQARRVLSEARLIEDLARDGRDELAGPLRFGAIYTAGPYLLPHLIPVLRERAPTMPLVIEENFTSRLLEQLRENELDVAILALPADLTGLAAWPLYDEDFVAVLPPGHRWAGLPSLPSKRLAEENLLLLGPGHCFREQVVQACPKCVDADGDGPRPQTGSSLETIRHMVAGGLGITVLPRSLVDNRSDEAGLIVAKPFAAQAPSRRIALVWRKTYPRLAAIGALRDAILASPLRGVTMLPGAQKIEA
jgi:LysR family hydrogen peroxide-inducible transcriptional activator